MLAVPLLYWLIPCTVCSLLITLGVDYLLRDKLSKESFWRHWWHMPILVIIEFILCLVLSPFIWRSGDEGDPRMFLEWDLILLLAVSIVCTSWVIWQMWQYTRSRNYA